MNYPTKTADIVAIILEFVELQNNLISAFRETFPQITDWEYLLDSPRAGCFGSLGEEWKFQRHGVGICFTGQKSGKVVDAHLGMSEYPRAFDSWRLAQYFDSIDMQKIDYFSDIFEVGDEDGMEKLLNYLLKDGSIAIALGQRKLYKLQD